MTEEQKGSISGTVKDLTKGTIGGKVKEVKDAQEDKKNK